jgi:hypothetical protein
LLELSEEAERAVEGTRIPFAFTSEELVESPELEAELVVVPA